MPKVKLILMSAEKENWQCTYNFNSGCAQRERNLSLGKVALHASFTKHFKPLESYIYFKQTILIENYQHICV